MAAQTLGSDAGGAHTDHRLLTRLALAAFILVDATDFPYRLITAPEKPWGLAPQWLAGLVACLSLLWAWPRTLVVSTVVMAGFVVGRQQITGFELWWLPIAVALAVVRRSASLSVLVVVICAVFCGWTYQAQGRAAMLGMIVLCLIGAGAGLVISLISTHRAAAEARVEALHAENARLKGEERRLLAADLRATTEDLFSHARREITKSVASTNPADLHQALDAVRDDARAALASLRQLLGVLRVANVEAGTELAPRRQGVAVARSIRVAMAVSLAALAGAGVLRVAPDATSGEWVLIAALLAAALTCWRPELGAPVSLLLVASTLYLDATSWAVGASVAAVVAAAALAPWSMRWRLAALTGVLLYAVQRLVLGGPDVLHDLAAVAVGALGATLTALAVREYLHTLRRRISDEERLASERVEIGPGERKSLARDLHDQLGHHLSLVALQVNAVDHVDDPVQLREALGRIDATLASASGELEMLLSAMSEAPASAQVPGPLVTATVVARVMTDKLAQHGHEATLVVEPAVDDLDPTTQLTIVRVLQEATTNVLRHGALAGEVRGHVWVRDHVVHLWVTNSVASGGAAGRLAHLSSGHGLRGIRERVEMSGGTFSAGAVGSQWRLEVDLPVDAAIQMVSDWRISG